MSGKSLETRDLPASKMKWRSSSQLSTVEFSNNFMIIFLYISLHMIRFIRLLVWNIKIFFFPINQSEENSNNLHNKDADILDISSGILHLAGDVLVPKVIEKDALRGAKVLQQVDRKYIPVVGGGVLAFIDQVHALPIPLNSQMNSFVYIHLRIAKEQIIYNDNPLPWKHERNACW